MRSACVDRMWEVSPMTQVTACGVALLSAFSIAYVATGRSELRARRRRPEAAGRRSERAPRPSRVERMCRACGWELDRPGWVDSAPTNAICDCCAAEAGVDDLTPEQARRYRRRWIEHGAEWFDPEFRPPRWDLYDQLCELAAT
jgi:hypothetical protein